MKRRRKTPTQLSLEMFGWGGARDGAGRKPKGNKAGVAHRPRARLSRHCPVHVTAKLRIRQLRRRDRYRVIEQALALGGSKPGFAVVEFTVQSDHLHLLCEADDRQRLARGLQGLFIRIARRLNKALGRSGQVFAERYHDRVLGSPSEVLHALRYVLNNGRKHLGPKRGYWFDPCSSARWFYLEATDRWLPGPRTWLLRVGWRRAGPLAVEQAPAGSS